MVGAKREAFGGEVAPALITPPEWIAHAIHSPSPVKGGGDHVLYVKNRTRVSP